MAIGKVATLAAKSKRDILMELSAVLPLKISGGHYEQNLELTRILLDSLELFLDLPAVLKIKTYCVKSEIGRAEELLTEAYNKIEISIIDEDELIPGIAVHKALGWYKQQAIKLAYAAQCETPFCLTLDPDIILCRPLRKCDIVWNGKCLSSWMTKQEHPWWWEASAEVLGYELNPRTLGLNVTPQLLSSELASRLQAHLGTRMNANTPWLRLLDVDERWTEYTLYSIFAERANLLEALHHRSHPTGRSLLGRSVWTKENRKGYSLSQIYADRAGGFFSVCASHAGFSSAEVRNMFEEMKTVYHNNKPVSEAL